MVTALVTPILLKPTRLLAMISWDKVLVHIATVTEQLELEFGGDCIQVFDSCGKGGNC
jgi:hypothetical protein